MPGRPRASIRRGGSRGLLVLPAGICAVSPPRPVSQPPSPCRRSSASASPGHPCCEPPGGDPRPRKGTSCRSFPSLASPRIGHGTSSALAGDGLLHSAGPLYQGTGGNGPGAFPGHVPARNRSNARGNASRRMITACSEPYFPGGAARNRALQNLRGISGKMLESQGPPGGDDRAAGRGETAFPSSCSYSRRCSSSSWSPVIQGRSTTSRGVIATMKARKCLSLFLLAASLLPRAIGRFPSDKPGLRGDKVLLSLRIAKARKEQRESPTTRASRDR
jgi:hypothetical protein